MEALRRALSLAGAATATAGAPEDFDELLRPPAGPAAEADPGPFADLGAHSFAASLGLADAEEAEIDELAAALVLGGGGGSWASLRRPPQPAPPLCPPPRWAMDDESVAIDCEVPQLPLPGAAYATGGAQQQMQCSSSSPAAARDADGESVDSVAGPLLAAADLSWRAVRDERLAMLQRAGGQPLDPHLRSEVNANHIMAWQETGVGECRNG